jgi:hypothetical protein
VVAEIAGHGGAGGADCARTFSVMMAASLAVMT